ncbi:MAG: ROK family protein [Clostridia bacterium]|nr:ROK family protein [Clostridia bacterium]
MYYIGVDLGGTNIAIGIVDENYNIVVKDKTPTKAGRDASLILDDMANLAADLVKRAGLTFDDIAYAGIAAPGTVDPVNGEIKYCNNIKMFHYPMAEELMKRIPVKKVYLENDANAAALAEAKAGAGKGKQDVIMITLGTGLGGGIVIGGKLYTGFNYVGAEIGHMAIEHGGRPCTCGRKGCWEAYSSATGLINITKDKLKETKDTVMWDMIEGDLDRVSGRTAFNAARQGDKAGQEVVDMYIDYLAYGMTNIVNVFQPEVFCIGGGVCGEGDYLLKPLAKLVDEQQYGTHSHDDKTEIKIAVLGNDAGIIGAALLGE